MVIYLTTTQSKELEIESNKNLSEISETNFNQNSNNLLINKIEKKSKSLTRLKLSSIGCNNNNIKEIDSNLKTNTISSTNVDRNEETPETTTSTTTSTTTTKKLSIGNKYKHDLSTNSMTNNMKQIWRRDSHELINNNNSNDSNSDHNDYPNNGLNSGLNSNDISCDSIDQNSGSSTSTLRATNNETNFNDINIDDIDIKQIVTKDNDISLKRINNNSNSNESLVTNATPNSSSSVNVSLPSPQLASSTSVAQALLICRKNSHPFTERRLSLDAPAKVGRAVARCKPSSDNSIFDCKVLSRNHALLWYEDGKFFLQDTRSSNGTFINNQRLSPANEESTPREVCSGDIVQFGVDVMENSRKVTHGCIIATVKLYLPDGTEAKASRVTQSDESQFNASQMQNAFQSNNFCISSQELFELSQYINEAIHREQILENKLETLQRVVTNAQESAHSGWKSLVEEDRLLSRIETLQSKLEVCLNNKGNNSGETSVNDIKEEMLKLIEDKQKYESAAKEAIQKALEEKLLVLTRLHEIETSIKSSEDECNRLQEVCEVSAKEINRLANCSDDLNKQIEELNKRLKAAEDQKAAVTEAAKIEKQALEEKIQQLKDKETETSHIITELKAINEAANTTIEQLKLQLQVIRQEQQVISGVENSTDIIDSKIKLSEELIDVQKQLDLSKSRCNELSAQIDALKQQTISTTTLTDSTASQNVDTNGVLTNGEIISTNENKNENSEAERVIIEVSAQSGDQTTSQLNSEIDLLKELLAETRASKKSTDEDLSRTLVEIENLKSNAKKFESEFDNNKQKLDKTLKEIEENKVIISSMKDQMNETNEKLKAAHLESEALKCKIVENEKLLNLKDDEISSLKVLLEEERKVQSKYANNYDQCRKQLLESQQLIKHSQTESDLLRKKVYSCNEELRTSRSNLSANDETNKSKEYDKLMNECLSLQSKLRSVESELFSYRDSNSKLVSDYESLQNSFELLQKLNHELESRGDNYWREQFNKAKSDADDAHSQLISIREQLQELNKNFEDCSKDNELLNEELKSTKEDYEIVSYQSKIASACAIIPLLMLLFAILLAYYPSVSTVTGTADS